MQHQIGLGEQRRHFQYVVADQVFQIRIFGNRDNLRFIIRKDDVAALVIFDDVHLDIRVAVRGECQTALKSQIEVS